MTVAQPHTGGLHLKWNLFLGQLNTSQVLSKSPGKAGRLSGVTSSMLRTGYTTKTVLDSCGSVEGMDVVFEKSL